MLCFIPKLIAEEDVPMSKVKFNVNTEYLYLQNFKVLQSTTHLAQCRSYQGSNLLDTFTRHNVDRPIPVEALIKCRMQDNLEFLQWTKRFWDQYFPGGEYDAIARRKGSGTPLAGSTAAPSRTSGANATRRGVTPTITGARAKTSTAGGVPSSTLMNENIQLKETVGGLERERDFYFSKLRDIELLVQQAMEGNPDLEKDENNLEKQIQNILYSTEVCCPEC